MLAENWKDFLKPSKVSYEVSQRNPNLCTIVVDPLERGFGITIGNSMRRVLLSSIYGTAIVEVKIEGVIHEQDVISGVKEDIVDIILNIKSVVISSDIPSRKKAEIKIKGPAVVKAKDIVMPQGAEVVNPEQVICTLDKGAEFKAELVIDSGKGYRDSSILPDHEKEIGVIPIDAVFSPIRRVSIKVDQSRVGQLIDYDKLKMEVETNGSIAPDLAVGIAAKILKEQMTTFINFDENVDSEPQEELEETKLAFNPVLLKKVDELELSVRSQNCLKNENIIYIGDLVRRSESDMLKTPNFGRKSLNEIKSILQAMELGFGMDIAEWPPENIEDLSKKFEDNA